MILSQLHKHSNQRLKTGLRNRDAKGLRAFADFLEQCEIASRYNPSLLLLNNDTQNKVMLSKLPDWIVSRWGREVYKTKQHYFRYPSFAQFVSFLSMEADIACDPVTTLQQERKVCSQATVHSGRTLQTSAVAEVNLCVYCQMSNHKLHKCSKFKRKSHSEKETFIKEKSLCFGCLALGHVSRSCKNRMTCDECHKPHPTILHKEGTPESKAAGHAGSGVQAEYSQWFLSQ